MEIIFIVSLVDPNQHQSVFLHAELWECLIEYLLL